MPPPASILPVLDAFRPEFSPRTWPRVVTLILGTILARGRRTVAAALRQVGLHDDPDFSSYHQVFNRAAWSPLRVARRLLSAAIAAFVPAGVGPDLRHRRDAGAAVGQEDPHPRPLPRPARLQQGEVGLRQRHPLDRPGPGRHAPWATRPWALPILSLPAPTPKVSAKLGRRHKTIAERARQMIARLRRWLPRPT